MNKNLKLFTAIFTLLYFFSSTVVPVMASVTYTYDANGNMTSDGTQCKHYNDANQMDKITNCATGQTIAEYVYDYQGNRVVKKVFNSGTLQKTTFSPSDEFETENLASNGATKNTHYYFANNQTIAKKDSTGAKTYYHNDHLGSTSLITNQAGVLVENTTYDPWGTIKTGGTKSKFLYTGQENDSETGLHYYNARYYDSHIRRFTQPDDIVEDVYNPQMLNRYTYVNNNPLRYTDPTGHCWGPWSVVCGAIASVAIRIFQPVVSLVTKIASSPTANRVVQTATKAQSNPVVQRVENNATRVVNNATVQKTTSNMSNTTKSGNITISTERMTHVLDSHATGGSLSQGKSIFSNANEIRDLIRNAEGVDPILQNNGRLRRVVDAGRIIGTDRETGEATSTYTVITDIVNNLKTAFPGVSK